MFPVISAFIAYSISDKLGIAPGFSWWDVSERYQCRLLGAIVSGLIAGYACLLIKNKIKLPKSMASVVPVFLVPVLGTLITVLLVNYVIGTPFAKIERWFRIMVERFKWWKCHRYGGSRWRNGWF